MTKDQIQHDPERGVDARVGNALIEVKFGVDAIRTVRDGLLRLAELVVEKHDLRGYLVLADSVVTCKRLHEEWDRTRKILKPELLKQLTVCFEERGRFRGVPRDPTPDMQAVLANIVRLERGDAAVRLTRTDYSFVIRKLLLYRLFMEPEPVTVDSLAKAAGCSPPTAAGVIRELGSLVRRTSDRRVELRYFPQDQFARLVANSERARAAVRFADMSGQARSPEEHVYRLEKLKPKNVAIGGVLGARHYFKSLDLVGAPRLDLSVHAPGNQMDLAFIERLDPALKREDDPVNPATVVVHAVRHAESLFVKRSEGLFWADPVECMLDLREGKLDAQAQQLLGWLEKRAKGWDRA